MNQFHLIQRWTLSVFGTAALLLTVWFLSSLTAQAASLPSNSTDTTMVPASCSLPATVTTATELADCITAANNNGPGQDMITLGTDITLSRALPQITTEIILEGGGFTIDGTNAFRVFDVGGGVS
ncbi:MAG: hypothetical protein GY764_01400 [Halieaceae bacterium]|nr:hypothetical protein [Halieaceae bacterium]